MAMQRILFSRLTVLLCALSGGLAMTGQAVAEPATPASAFAPVSASASASGTMAHFADATDGAAVTAGKELYRTHCARCHGRRLEGQALWQLHDEHLHERAPALDETGHAWQHSDEELFQITRSGRLPGMPADLVSRMPAASEKLSDTQILQVLAFMKARWTLGIRVSQSMLNPEFAGMPADANTVSWKLPPNCVGSLQSWRNENK